MKAIYFDIKKKKTKKPAYTNKHRYVILLLIFLIFKKF